MRWINTWILKCEHGSVHELIDRRSKKGIEKKLLKQGTMFNSKLKYFEFLKTLLLPLPVKFLNH